MVGHNVQYNLYQELCILVGCRLVLCNFLDLISYHYLHTYPPLLVNAAEDLGLVLDWEDMFLFYFSVIQP